MWIAVIVIIGLVFLLMFLGENEFQKEQDNLYKKCLENLIKDLK